MSTAHTVTFRTDDPPSQADFDKITEAILDAGGHHIDFEEEDL